MTEPLTDIPADTAALRALLDAMPAAPWRVALSQPSPGVRTDAGWEVVHASYDDHLTVLEFIAAARNQLPALLDANEWLSAELHKVCNQRNGYHERAETAEATLAAVRKFSAGMRDYCSPHGVSVHYADQLDAVLGAVPAAPVPAPADELLPELSTVSAAELATMRAIGGGYIRNRDVVVELDDDPDPDICGTCGHAECDGEHPDAAPAAPAVRPTCSTCGGSGDETMPNPNDLGSVSVHGDDQHVATGKPCKTCGGTGDAAPAAVAVETEPATTSDRECDGSGWVTLGPMAVRCLPGCGRCRGGTPYAPVVVELAEVPGATANGTGA